MDNSSEKYTPQGHNPSSYHQGTILKDRFTSEDIFERIIQVAGEEIHTKFWELFFSSLAAGFAITLTFYLYATLTYTTGGHPILSSMLYPLGFLFIVLGNYQLFTENTLPPVALFLEKMTSLFTLLRVWVVVLFGNLLGGLLGALILAKANVFSSGASQAAVEIGLKASSLDFGTLIVRGAFAGFIVAGVVWVDYSSKDNTSRFLMTYLGFLAIPLAGLNHVVVTASEIGYLFFRQGIPLISGLLGTALPVLLGNIIGGVFFVTFVNYFQTPSFIKDNPCNRLPWKKWLFSFSTYKEQIKGHDCKKSFRKKRK